MKTYFPARPNGIALIGDVPRAKDSVSAFDGGYFGSLAAYSRDAGFNIRDCMMANVLNFYPEDGKWSSVALTQIAECSERVKNELRQYQPKAIVLLGDNAARMFKPEFSNIDDERGQPFLWENIPTLIAMHPRSVWKRFKFTLVTIHDLSKAFRYSREGWKPPELNLEFLPNLTTVLARLADFAQYKPWLSCDIETNSRLLITCIGFAYSATNAITIPFVKDANGSPYWTIDEEKLIWKALVPVLETCPLIGHHAVHFDHWVLAMKYGIRANFVGDTEFAHWECYNELLKSLGFCSSIYTDMPYWKDVLRQARAGKVPYWKEFEYNGKDACICFQCAEKISHELRSERPPGVYEHYLFNIRISRAFQYMGIHGAKLHQEKLRARLVELEKEKATEQLRLNAESGFEINVNSPKQMQKWLYDELKLPVQYKLVKDEDGDTEQTETADYLSLLYLARMYPNLPALLTAARVRKLRKRISSLTAYQARPSGYVGWAHNCVGTVTGRASGYKPLDGFGVQPQNVDRKDRDLFLPPDDFGWIKADLEGADSWTVAAQCQALGDPTMMNDLLAGVKPAQALAIAHLFGAHLITAPTETVASYKKALKAKSKEEEAVRGPGRTTYDVMKAVSHGSNYGMQKHTMHQNIFKKSNGETWVAPDDCVVFQELYFKRYPGIRKLHEQIVSLMNDVGYLDSFGGTRRYFLGRKDNATVRDMCSDLPQANTTFATNRLIERIYYWSENRKPDKPNSLIVRPVNQVHDETDLVFPLDKRDFTKALLMAMTDLPMECWGVKFTIPFEIKWGPSWGECESDL